MTKSATWTRSVFALVALAFSTTAALATALPGPDAFGYQGIEIQGASSRDMRTTDTEEIPGDDELTAAIPLGFTFS